jgi:hypothetical protein
MGEYCFIKLFEAEGKRNTPDSKLQTLAYEIRGIIENQ